MPCRLVLLQAQTRSPQKRSLRTVQDSSVGSTAAVATPDALPISSLNETDGFIYIARIPYTNVAHDIKWEAAGRV
jgi:hypothetical protein